VAAAAYFKSNRLSWRWPHGGVRRRRRLHVYLEKPALAYLSAPRLPKQPASPALRRSRTGGLVNTVNP